MHYCFLFFRLHLYLLQQNGEWCGPSLQCPGKIQIADAPVHLFLMWFAKQFGSFERETLSIWNYYYYFLLTMLLTYCSSAVDSHCCSLNTSYKMHISTKQGLVGSLKYGICFVSKYLDRSEWEPLSAPYWRGRQITCTHADLVYTWWMYLQTHEAMISSVQIRNVLTFLDVTITFLDVA